MPTPPTARPVDPVPTRHRPPDIAELPSDPVLYTADRAAALLQVRPSWLKRKAAARAVPCRYVGKHLRFSPTDITAIADASAQPARQPRRRPLHS